ncbi:MAG: hypothetical protein AAFQ02_11645 [Bacteroidota bacterium]
MSQRPSKAYVKYSGLALQMFVVLFMGFWGGSKLDEVFGFDRPYIGGLLCLMILFGFFYKIIADTNSGRL